jgi:hypothetical protein
MRGHRQHAALVDSWFELLPAGQQPGARALHAVVRDAAPQLELTVRGGGLVYALNGLHVMALAPFHSHLHLQVFRGAALAARFPELEGSSKGLRQLRIRHGQQFDALLVEAIVKAAVAESTALPTPRDLP